MIEDFGFEGDAHAGDWHRQVSLLASESIEKTKDAGLDVSFGDFAENIATEGVDWKEIPVGTKVRIGESVLLEITQIGKECIRTSGDGDVFELVAQYPGKRPDPFRWNDFKFFLTD